MCEGKAGNREVTHCSHPGLADDSRLGSDASSRGGGIFYGSVEVACGAGRQYGVKDDATVWPKHSGEWHLRGEMGCGEDSRVLLSMTHFRLTS